MNEVINKIEIRALGLMRSGNHAIISWLLGLYPESKICFLNNLKHGDLDPFQSCAQRELFGIEPSEDFEVLRSLKKDVLVYSYEDRRALEERGDKFLDSVFNQEFEEHRLKYFGKSENRFDLVIVRDPFNCLASRLTLLRKRGGLGGCTDMKVIKKSWIEVAEKALQVEHDSSGHQLVVNYNKWVSDESYQREISDRLKGEFVANSLAQAPRYGGGSSYKYSRLMPKFLVKLCDRILRLSSPSNLKPHTNSESSEKNSPDELFNRWQRLREDEEFRGLFKDGELLRLSLLLFGDLPGTQDFVRDLNEGEASYPE